MNFNSRKFNSDIWDVPSNSNRNQNFQQHGHQPFLSSNQQQFFGNGQNFQNNNFYSSNLLNQNQNNYSHHNANSGSMFNDNMDYSAPPQRRFNNNMSRANRPGPAFSKRPPVWENQPSFPNNDNYGSTSSNISNDSFSSYSSKDKDYRQDQIGLKGALERLKANKKKSSQELNDMCEKNATVASKKLLTEIRTMKKDDVKGLINNPKQPFKKKVLNIQAKQNIREQNRQKLRTLGNEGDVGELEADEAIDCKDIPDCLLAEINKSSNLDTDDNEVLQKNLGNDFLTGSEKLLMSGFSLLGDEDEDTPRFDVPKNPPLPKEKTKPPLPDENPDFKPAYQTSEKLPYGLVSFYGSSKDWEVDVEKSINPEPPLLPEPVESDPPLKPDPPQIVENIQSIPVCDYTTGLRPHFSPQYEDIQKSITTIASETSLVNVEVKKIVSPSIRIVEIPRISPSIAASPSTSSTPKIVPAPSPLTTPTLSVEKTPKENPSIVNETQTSKENEVSAQGDGRRANETYGEHKRRMAAEAAERRKKEEEMGKSENPQEKSFDSSQSVAKPKGPQCVQNLPKDRNWKNSSRWGWKNDSRSNNDQRNSRGDMDRERDRRNRNWNHQQNPRYEAVEDAHNHRFNNSSNAETDSDKFNSSFNPKSLDSNNRSFNVRNRDRTPTNNSPNREFSESSYVPPDDYRPCYYTLKKIMEKDAEISRVQHKIQEIDKSIQTLQTDRNVQQRNFNKLTQERKYLFENLMKRAEKKRKSPERESQVLSVKQEKQSKLQNMVDMKKRKNDEILDETLKKKPAIETTVESASAYEKLEKLRKEKENEERIKKIIEERKRKRQIRLEREEAEKRKLEEQIRQEELKSTKIIKTENRERSNDRQKSRSISKDRNQSVEKHHQPAVEKSDRKSSKSKTLIHLSETLPSDNVKITQCSIKVLRMSQKMIDDYINNVQDGEENAEINELDEESIHENPENFDDEAASNVDFNNEDTNEESVNEIEDSIKIELQAPTPEPDIIEDEFDEIDPLLPTIDYTEWNGNFTSHCTPIVHLQVARGKYLLAACEDGRVLKYRLIDGELLAKCDEHKQICNMILYDNIRNVFSVSSDGFMNQIDFETFNLKSFVDFGEAIQIIEKYKTNIFVGCKSGNIYKLNSDLIQKPTEPLCNTNNMVFCIKPCKEGPRNVLLVSSKYSGIQVRDAKDGLLLRTLIDGKQGFSIYDMIIDGGTIYYGSNENNVVAIDFTNGALKKSHPSGKGTISLKIYKNLLIAACYDGNIYIVDKTKDDTTLNMCGPSNMVLALDLWQDKMVAATKDESLKIINIPSL